MLFSLTSCFLLFSFIFFTFSTSFLVEASSSSSSSPVQVGFEYKTSHLLYPELSDDHNNNENDENNYNSNNNKKNKGGGGAARKFSTSCNSSFGEGNPCPDLSMAFAEGSFTRPFTPGAVQRGGLDLKISLGGTFQFHKFFSFSPSLSDISSSSGENDHQNIMMTQDQKARVQNFFANLVYLAPDELKNVIEEMFPYSKHPLYSGVPENDDDDNNNNNIGNQQQASSISSSFFSAFSSSSNNNNNNNNNKQNENDNMKNKKKKKLQIHLSEDRRSIYLIANPVPGFVLDSSSSSSSVAGSAENNQNKKNNNNNNKKSTSSSSSSAVSFAVDFRSLDCQCQGDLRTNIYSKIIPDTLPSPLSLTGAGNLCHTDDDPYQFRISIGDCEDGILPFWTRTTWTVTNHLLWRISQSDDAVVFGPETKTSACAMLGLEGFEFNVQYIVKVNVSVNENGAFQILTASFVRRRKPVPLLLSFPSSSSSSSGSSSVFETIAAAITSSGAIKKTIFGRSVVLPLRNRFRHPDSFRIDCRGVSDNINNNQDEHQEHAQKLSVCFINETAVRLVGFTTKMNRILCEVTDTVKACGRGAKSDLSIAQVIQADILERPGDRALDNRYENPACGFRDFWSLSAPGPDGSLVSRRLCGDLGILQSRILFSKFVLATKKYVKSSLRLRWKCRNASPGVDISGTVPSSSFSFDENENNGENLFEIAQQQLPQLEDNNNKDKNGISSPTVTAHLPQQSSTVKCVLELVEKVSVSSSARGRNGEEDNNNNENNNNNNQRILLLVRDSLEVQLERVRQRYPLPSFTRYPITTKTRNLRINNPIDLDDEQESNKVVGYWFVGYPLSIIPAEGDDLVSSSSSSATSNSNSGSSGSTYHQFGDNNNNNKTQNNNNNNSQETDDDSDVISSSLFKASNELGKPQRHVNLGNLPVPYSSEIPLVFLEESVYPCLELAWNASIDVSVAAPEIYVSPRVIWTDQEDTLIFAPELVQPDERGNFDLLDSNPHTEEKQNFLGGACRMQPTLSTTTLTSSASVSGSRNDYLLQQDQPEEQQTRRVSLEVTGSQTARVSSLEQGRCVRLSRSISNAAGNISAPYVVRRCTSVPSHSACMTAQRVYTSMSDSVHISALPIPKFNNNQNNNDDDDNNNQQQQGELEGKWTCEHGDVHVEDPINSPHEAVVKHLPRGSTLCKWTVEGKGEEGRYDYYQQQKENNNNNNKQNKAEETPTFLCPPCVTQVRVVAAASDCPPPLQATCSAGTVVPLFDANVLLNNNNNNNNNQDVTSSLQYILDCPSGSKNQQHQPDFSVNMQKGEMMVSNLQLGATKCTLQVFDSSSSSSSSSAKSNKRECPIVFERRLAPLRPLFISTIPSSSSSSSGDDDEEKDVIQDHFYAIAGHPLTLKVNVTVPGGNFAATAFWEFKSVRRDITSDGNNNNNNNNNNNRNNVKQIFEKSTSEQPSHVEIFKSASEQGDGEEVTSALVTFKTNFVPRVSGLYTASVRISDPLHVCPDVSRQINAVVVDSLLARENIYSCGATSQVSAVPFLTSAASATAGSQELPNRRRRRFLDYVDMRWVLAARSSQNPNCTRAVVESPFSFSTSIIGLGYGVCSFDWIVSMKHNSSMARWKTVNVDTLSENVPANGTSYLVAGEVLSLWSSTRSSEWNINSPPGVTGFRASVQPSRTRRSILVTGLEVSQHPYKISYRVGMLRNPPASYPLPVECPRHRFEITRVDVKIHARLTGLKSECDLVRGGMVTLELQGEPKFIQFKNNFDFIEAELRKANNCSFYQQQQQQQQQDSNSNNNNNNAPQNVQYSKRYQQYLEQERNKKKNCHPRFWASSGAEWSDFSLDRSRRVLRFRLRMNQFLNEKLDLSDGNEFFFSSEAIIPLNLLRGLSGTDHSSASRARRVGIPIKNQKEFKISAVSPISVRVGLKTSDSSSSAMSWDILSEFNKNDLDQEQEATNNQNNNNNNNNNNDNDNNRRRRLVVADEYDIASGNVHFNVSFARHVLRPISTSDVIAWTNFTSCPVLADAVLGGGSSSSSSSSSSSANSQQRNQMNYQQQQQHNLLRGRCLLFPSQEGGEDNQQELFNQIGAKYDFTVSSCSSSKNNNKKKGGGEKQENLILLRLSKRSLCGLCDRRLTLEDLHAALRLEANHLNEQKTLSWKQISSKYHLSVASSPSLSSSSDDNTNNNQQQENDVNNNNNENQQKDDCSSSSADANATSGLDFSLEEASSLVDGGKGEATEKDSQQNENSNQKHSSCSKFPVQFTPNDWVTLGAINVRRQVGLKSSIPVARQCQVAFGLGSFQVKALHGYFDQSSSSSSSSGGEFPLEILPYFPAAEKLQKITDLLKKKNNKKKNSENINNDCNQDDDGEEDEEENKILMEAGSDEKIQQKRQTLLKQLAQERAAFDWSTFETIRSNLKPNAFIKNGRQLLVRVDPVTSLQFHTNKNPELVVKLVAVNRWFNGASIVNGSFTLKILRSSARLDFLPASSVSSSVQNNNNNNNLTHVCENTLKNDGVVARISLDGDEWHPRVGDGSQNAFNFAMINAFFDSPHTFMFEGGGGGGGDGNNNNDGTTIGQVVSEDGNSNNNNNYEDVTILGDDYYAFPKRVENTNNNNNNQKSTSSQSGSLASPFCSYLSTVLRPHHVIRLSKNVVEIRIPSCQSLAIQDEGSSSVPACASVQDYTNFKALEMISFAVPGIATSCPGCLVTQPPVAVFGLAASVQPIILNQQQLQQLRQQQQGQGQGQQQQQQNGDGNAVRRRTAILNFVKEIQQNQQQTFSSRFFTSPVPALRPPRDNSNDKNNNNHEPYSRILPTEIFLRSRCGNWIPPTSSSSSSSSSSSIFSNFDQQQLLSQNIFQKSLNAEITNVRLASPTLLEIQLRQRTSSLSSGGSSSFMNNNNNRNSNGKQDESDDDSDNYVIDRDDFELANALIPVPVEWLYNSSQMTKMSRVDPWSVNLRLDVTLLPDGTRAFSSSSSNSRRGGKNSSKGWFWASLQHYSLITLFGLFTAYLSLLAWTKWFTPNVRMSAQFVGFQVFVTSPVSLIAFALTLSLDPSNLFIGLLVVAPWIVLERAFRQSTRLMQSHNQQQNQQQRVLYYTGSVNATKRGGAGKMDDSIPFIYWQLFAFHVLLWIYLAFWE